MRLYLAGCQIVLQKLHKDMDSLERLSLAAVIIFGAVHAGKETLLSLISIISNTTYLERAQGFQKIYFKSGQDGFLVNPFDKGITLNIKEVIWTTFGLKNIVDPLDKLPKLDASQQDDEIRVFNMQEKEEFFDQLNPDI